MTKVTNQSFGANAAYTERVRRVKQQFKIPVRVRAGSTRIEKVKNDPDGDIKWLGLAIVWMEIPKSFTAAKFKKKHGRPPKPIDYARAAVIVRKKRRVDGRTISESIRYQKNRPTKTSYKPTMRKDGYILVPKITSVLDLRRQKALDDMVKKIAFRMLFDYLSERHLIKAPRPGEVHGRGAGW